MKKSKKIQLVLITAALASCNRQLFPKQPDPVYDPGYVDMQSDSGRVYSDTSDACEIDPAMYDGYDPYYYPGAYYPGGYSNWYSILRPVFRSHRISRRRGFIPRGGFGKTAVTAIS